MSTKFLERFVNYRADMFCDGQADGHKTTMGEQCIFSGGVVWETKSLQPYDFIQHYSHIYIFVHVIKNMKPVSILKGALFGG